MANGKKRAKKQAKKAVVSRKKLNRAGQRVAIKKEVAKIISNEPVFGTKHPLCNDVAHFYSMPGQINLVLHGVPFRLIEDQFVRFHAVHSTVIGWNFTLVYTVLVFSAIVNTFLFKGAYAQYLIWAALVLVGVHSIVNIYLAYKTRQCKEISLPIITDAARRISG